MSDQYDNDLMTCVHCGLCLNSCPTYLETGSEADSPRGRIVLMRGMHEGRLSPDDPDVVEHIDRCLGCRACESACPSNVPYGSLVEVARDRINKAGVRAPKTALSRRALLSTMTNPSAMSAAMKASRLVSRAGAGMSVPAFAVRMLSADPAAAAQVKALPSTIAPELPPAFTPAVGEKRFRVGMLTGCVMRVLYGDVNADTVSVLAANGCEVLVNRRQGCCGALHLHNGHMDDGRNMARQLIDAFTPFDGLDAIVINSAGCGSTMKEYGDLLADDPAYAERAAAFSAKVRDVSEFLDEADWVAPLKTLPGTDGEIIVAYHDACHLSHGQQIREAPRSLLARIPGVKLVPLAESEICCGSAGIYNLTQPEMARRLQARKVDNVLATGASVVATGNPGCLSWIEAGIAEHGLDAPIIVHPITLLAAAIDNVV